MKDLSVWEPGSAIPQSFYFYSPDFCNGKIKITCSNHQMDIREASMEEVAFQPGITKESYITY